MIDKFKLTAQDVIQYEATHGNLLNDIACIQDFNFKRATLDKMESEERIELMQELINPNYGKTIEDILDQCLKDKEFNWRDWIEVEEKGLTEFFLEVTTSFFL